MTRNLSNAVEVDDIYFGLPHIDKDRQAYRHINIPAGIMSVPLSSQKVRSPFSGLTYSVKVLVLVEHII